MVYLHVYFPVHSNSLKDIAGYLGFCWSDPDASGLQSVVWRHRWEESGSIAFKEKLVTYNLEDCEALRRVADFLYEACLRPQVASQQPAPAHVAIRLSARGGLAHRPSHYQPGVVQTRVKANVCVQLSNATARCAASITPLCLHHSMAHDELPSG